MDGRTRTVRLTRDDVPLYRLAIANGQRLDKLIASWVALSLDALKKLQEKDRR